MATESASFTCESEQRPRSVTAPRVSLVMGAYNDERFLRPAIESILNQTFRDFELIVIDDCSTDATPRILKGFKDDRMRVFRNERNLGIAETLNKGIAIARGEYVALQDHDDLSQPDRFSKQVAFLETHPRVGMVGSSCNVIDEAGNYVEHWPVECDHVKLKWALLWHNTFFHTTLMIRRSAIEEVGGYSSNPEYRFAEDYDLMSRVACRHGVANIALPLGCWRMHEASASQLNRGQQEAAAKSISQRNVCRLLGWDRMDPMCWQGMERFLRHPVGQELDLTTAEVNRTLDFLASIDEKFCSAYGFGRREAAMHRRRIVWPWGRHALALSYRRNGRRDAVCRLSLFAGGAKLVIRAFRAVWW